jgi:hypothetical protein
MSHILAVRRKLFMHSAHRTVGVSGGGAALGPYCRTEGFSTDVLAIAPLRVALVACTLDADACAALALFERAIARHGDIQCGRVEFESADARSEDLANVDCAVLFRRGLHIARRWTDFGTVEPVENQCRRETPHYCNGCGFGDEGELLEAKIEIAPAARRHPILDGVEPFVSYEALHGVCICPDATLLLTSRAGGEVHPAAWIEPGRRDRVFHTTLGCAEDFGRPDFIRLMLNALTWIGR